MANIELDGANKKIKVDSGDLTLDVPGDIILDADGADLVFADGGTNILKVTNSSSDTVFQPQVDAKDIKFNQYDGRTLLDINDGGYVAIANGATGPGQLRLYEDTDNGTNYSAFQVGTQSGDITYTLPTADGSNGHALTTNGSGTLSWASAGTTYAGIDDQSSSNDDQLTITDTAIVINEDSDDLDFRVESNGNANMLFVSGGNDVVGIGAEGDLGEGLHIKNSDSGLSSIDSTGFDNLVVETSGNSGMMILSGTSSSGGIMFGDSGDDDIGYLKYDHSANKFTLSVNADGGTMIMTSDGNIQHGGTTNSGRYAAYTSGNEAVGYFQCTKSSSYNQSCMNVVGDQDTSNESYNIYKGSAGGTAKFFVRDSGNVENVNNSYGASSDERIKQNITDANSQWDDIKALKVRNYKLKTEAAKGVDKTYLGVVAQEVEAAGMTGLVGGSTAEDGKTVALNSDFGTVYTEQDKTDGNIPEGKDVGDIKTLDQKVKSIKYSVLYMKAIKALQEAQTRIETLETKVKALEDA